MLVIGCKSDESKASDLADRASSWAATAGVVTTGMAQNKLPLTFGRNTLEDAQKELDAARKQIVDLRISDSTRREVMQALSGQADSLARLKTELARRKQ